MKQIFITGVDTDIGKTFISIGLALALEKQNKKVGYYKPFQSGAYEENNRILAPDIEELKKYSNNIEAKTTYLLKGEVSPYLAAKLSKVSPDIKNIKKDLEDFSKDKDIVIVEGAGGLYCPLVKNMLYKDLISYLNIETIIVTTPDLGRLNHTLMTLECAKNNNIKVKGLIINKTDNKTTSQEHFLEELKDFSDVKILATIPNLKNPKKEEIIELFKDISI